MLYVVTLDETGIDNSYVSIIQNFILSHPGITCELMEIEKSELAIIASSKNQDDCKGLSDALVNELREAGDLSVFDGGEVYGWHEIILKSNQIWTRERG